MAAVISARGGSIFSLEPSTTTTRFFLSRGTAAAFIARDFGGAYTSVFSHHCESDVLPFTIGFEVEETPPRRENHAWHQEGWGNFVRTLRSQQKMKQIYPASSHPGERHHVVWRDHRPSSSSSVRVRSRPAKGGCWDSLGGLVHGVVLKWNIQLWDPGTV